MDDEPTNPDTAASGRVSFDKGSGARSTPARAGSGLGILRGKPNRAADGSPMPPPPPSVRNAVVALAVTAIASLIASLTLFGNKQYLYETYKKSNPDPGKKNHQTLAELHRAADKAPASGLLVSVVLLIALVLAASGVWRGRYWARWTVIALWVLATLTSTFASFIYIPGIASDEPLVFKAPSFVAAVALIAAVVFVSIRPSAEYFARTRQPRPGAAAGAPPRRGGLFGPRPSAPTPAKPARDDTARDTVARSRSKQRASSDSVAKGAELARARAKASKSRRSGA